MKFSQNNPIMAISKINRNVIFLLTIKNTSNNIILVLYFSGKRGTKILCPQKFTIQGK